MPTDLIPYVLPAAEVESAGFAQFNGGRHLCVNVPDGHTTITCRTSEGRKVTFAFVPYHHNGPPQCVDIQHHDTGKTIPNHDIDLDVQKVICFHGARHRTDFGYSDEKPVTLTCLILQPHEEPSDK